MKLEMSLTARNYIFSTLPRACPNPDNSLYLALYCFCKCSIIDAAYIGEQTDWICWNKKIQKQL